MHHRPIRLAAAMAFAAVGAQAVMAQDTEISSANGEVLSFLPEYFTEFRPNTVVDMLNRLPGFSYNEGQSNVRGAAGSAGNVLVDGSRPTSKSLSLGDILRRLPLQAIERIDLIRGGAPGIDMQGMPMVANIIRKPGGYTEATVRLWTKIYNDHRPAQIPTVELTRSWGNWSVGGAVNYREEREQDDSGTGDILRHNLLTDERQYAPFGIFSTKRTLDGNLGIEYASGAHLLRLNASGKRATEKRREELEALLAVNDEDWKIDRTDNLGEFSLNYEYSFPSGLISRALLLRRAERKRRDGSSDIRGADQQANENNLARETIARLSATWPVTPSLTLEGSAEGSRNTLDATSSLVAGGIPVVLPSADLRVAETRGNLDASARFQATPRLSIELGTGFERSTISQSGDASNEKTLDYWKPRLNLTFDPIDRLQIRIRGERMVGQLDFKDFAASASTEPGVSNAGNPDLVPETSWFTSFAIEQRFWGRGALTLTYEHEFLNDVLDFIPIDNRFDAPGNIGDGWRNLLTLEMTLPTDRLSIPGGEVRLKLTRRDSGVTDPVTGERRRIRDQWPHWIDLKLSKNLPGLNSVLGTDIFLGYEKTTYRLKEIRVERASSQPLARLYWDWNPNPKTSIRFQVENYTFRSRGRTRIQYQGTRASGVIAAIEDREVALDPFFMVWWRRRF